MWLRRSLALIFHMHEVWECTDCMPLLIIFTHNSNPDWLVIITNNFWRDVGFSVISTMQTTKYKQQLLLLPPLTVQLLLLLYFFEHPLISLLLTIFNCMQFRVVCFCMWCFTDSFVIVKIWNISITSCDQLSHTMYVIIYDWFYAT